MGNYYATDYITIDGNKVDFMNCENPETEDECGWTFLSGLETQEYLDNPENTIIYDVNTIANYDEAIIPYLNFTVGSELGRE